MRFLCGCPHGEDCAAASHHGNEHCSAIGESPGPSGVPDGWKQIGVSDGPGTSMCGPCSDADPSGGFDRVVD